MQTTPAPPTRVYPYTTSAAHTASNTQMQHYQKGSPYQGGAVQHVGQPAGAGHTQTNSFSQQRSGKPAEPNLRSSLYQRAERYSTGQNHGMKTSNFSKPSNFRDREYRDYDDKNSNHRSIPTNSKNGLIQAGTQSATNAGAPNNLAGAALTGGGQLTFQ